MYFSFNQAKCWLENNQQKLALLTHPIILCPSYDILAFAAQLAKKHNFSVGAQDCSEHKNGAYTGQVCAQSLADIGCTHCIIGHNEQRYCLDNTRIYNKLQQLAHNNITPILCIGEPSAQQLEPALQFKTQLTTKELIIAYEPPVSIGSGIVSSKNSITNAINQIKTLVAHANTLKILYGGSVSPKNIAMLKSIEDLNGFLIGSASTNIAQLKAILETDSQFIQKAI